MKKNQIDFEEIVIENIIKQFKDQDSENYYMYKNSGLSDHDIYDIVTSDTIKPLYHFEEMGEVI